MNPLMKSASKRAFNFICKITYLQFYLFCYIIALSLTTRESELKLSELLRLLKAKGAKFSRHGHKHDIWVRGEFSAPVPRHDGKEIKNKTRDSILKQLGISE